MLGFGWADRCPGQMGRATARYIFLPDGGFQVNRMGWIAVENGMRSSVVAPTPQRG